MPDIIEDFHSAAGHDIHQAGQFFEKVVQGVYEAWLKPGDLAVDVGAHKGRHLIPMAKAVGPKGKVYGFEPIPKLHNRLRKTLKEMGVGNVKLHQLALSDTQGIVEFTYFEKRPAFSGLRQRPAPFDDAEGGVSKVQVRQSTLDKKLPFFRHVSAIKLDIEGGELHALMGARKCLQKSRPLVVFECGRQQSAETYGFTSEDFFSFFESTSMRVFWLSGEPFTRDHWASDRSCWEFVALPEEKAGFADLLPALCAEVLAKA